MKKYILTLLASVMMMSCEQQNDYIVNNESPKLELTKDEFTSIAFDNLQELTDYQVVGVVEKFLSHNLNKQARTSSIKDIKVDKKYYVSNKDDISPTPKKHLYNIPVYSVTVENDNCRDVALVSGDERVPFVIAHYTIDKNREEYFKQNDLNNDLMLDLSKNQIFQELEYIENLQDSLRYNTLKKISESLNIEVENVKFGDIKNKLVIKEEKVSTRADMIVDPNNIFGTVIGRFGPWCHVKWDVGMPYNRTMPQECQIGRAHV